MSLKLNVARIVERTKAEGPGWRAAVWVQGCPILCPGCCNPAFLPFRDRHWIEIDRLEAFLCSLPNIEGVSYLGGEPMAQAEALADLSSRLHQRGLSIVTYTGYTLDDIWMNNDPYQLALVGVSDMLIAGPYLQEQHTEAQPWIGSANQIVHYLSERYQSLDGYTNAAQMNRIDVRINEKGEIRLNGFAYHGLLERLRTAFEERGLLLENHTNSDRLAYLSDDYPLAE